MRERFVEFSFTRVPLSEALEYRELICLLPLSLSLTITYQARTLLYSYRPGCQDVAITRSIPRCLTCFIGIVYSREIRKRDTKERDTDMREALLSRMVRVLRPRVRSHRVASRYVLVRHPHASDMSIDTSTIHLLSFD